MAKPLDILLPILGGLLGTTPEGFRGVMAAESVSRGRRRSKLEREAREKQEQLAKQRKAQGDKLIDAARKSLGQYSDDPMSKMMMTRVEADPFGSMAALAQYVSQRERIKGEQSKQRGMMRAQRGEELIRQGRIKMQENIYRLEEAGDWETANQYRAQLGLAPRYPAQPKMERPNWNTVDRLYKSKWTGAQISQATGIPLEMLPWPGQMPEVAADAAGEAQDVANIEAAKTKVLQAEDKVMELNEEIKEIHQLMQEAQQQPFNWDLVQEAKHRAGEMQSLKRKIKVAQQVLARDKAKLDASLAKEKREEADRYQKKQEREAEEAKKKAAAEAKKPPTDWAAAERGGPLAQIPSVEPRDWRYPEQPSAAGVVSRDPQTGRLVMGGPLAALPPVRAEGE